MTASRKKEEDRARRRRDKEKREALEAETRAEAGGQAAREDDGFRMSMQQLTFHSAAQRGDLSDVRAALKMKVSREENLRTLPYATLWQRMFDQFSNKDNSQHY